MPVPFLSIAEEQGEKNVVASYKDMEEAIKVIKKFVFKNQPDLLEVVQLENDITRIIYLTIQLNR